MLNGALIYAKYPPKEPVMKPGTIVPALSLAPSLPRSPCPTRGPDNVALPCCRFFFMVMVISVFLPVKEREREVQKCGRGTACGRYPNILRVYKTVACTSRPTVGVQWSISCNEEVKKTGVGSSKQLLAPS